MNRFAVGYPLLTLAISLGAACAPDNPSVTAPVGSPLAPLARGKPTSAAYTSSDLGALLGNNSSLANGVNDAGDVVGGFNPFTSAFAILDGVATTLPGELGNAKAISNGSPKYVVGFAGSTSAPVRWTIVNGAPSAPQNLALLSDEVGGTALGVNDAGAAVGVASDTARQSQLAAMWSDAGVRTTVDPPAGRGFVNGEGRDIDNAGHAVFVFFLQGGNVEDAPARGFLRLASGNLVELSPLAGDVTTYANGLSEVQNNTVYIAGTSRTSQFVFRAVRWTVDVTTGAILATAVRPENSHALAVSTNGATVGFLEANAARTPRYTAFLWRGNDLLALNPPKGARNGIAWAVSPSGEFVAGEAAGGLSRTAILWTILSP